MFCSQKKPIKIHLGVTWPKEAIWLDKKMGTNKNTNKNTHSLPLWYRLKENHYLKLSCTKEVSNRKSILSQVLSKIAIIRLSFLIDHIKSILWRSKLSLISFIWLSCFSDTHSKVFSQISCTTMLRPTHQRSSNLRNCWSQG